jgi:hypothetical protein
LEDRGCLERGPSKSISPKRVCSISKQVFNKFVIVERECVEENLTSVLVTFIKLDFGFKLSHAFYHRIERFEVFEKDVINELILSNLLIHFTCLNYGFFTLLPCTFTVITSSKRRTLFIFIWINIGDFSSRSIVNSSALENITFLSFCLVNEALVY